MLVTMRLRERDVRAARREAKAMGIPYQHVVREWVALAAAKKAA